MFATPTLSGVRSDASNPELIQASKLFWKRHSQARLHARWAGLLGNPAGLQPLARALQNTAVESRHYAGVQLVALDAIRGSESRSGEFDAAFRPLHRRMVQRWVRVASAWFAGIVFAPVVLIQLGDDYFVRDGHHRISIARATGQRYIDAEVTVWELSGHPAPPQPVQKVRPALRGPRQPAFAV